MSKKENVLWRTDNGELVDSGQQDSFRLLSEMSRGGDKDVACCTLDFVTKEGFDTGRFLGPDEKAYRLEFSAHVAKNHPLAEAAVV